MILPADPTQPDRPAHLRRLDIQIALIDALLADLARGGDRTEIRDRMAGIVLATR